MNTDQIKELKKNKNYDKFEYDYNKKYESNSGIKVIAPTHKDSPEKKVWDYKKKNGNECIQLVDSLDNTYSPKVNNSIMEFYIPKSPTPTKSTPSKASITISTSPNKKTTTTTNATLNKSNKLDFNKVEDDEEEESTSDNEYEDANGGINNQEDEEEDKSHNSDDSDNENMFEQDDYDDTQDEIKLPKPEQNNQNEKQLQTNPLEKDLIDDLCSQLENVLDFLSKQECTEKNADLSHHTRKFLKQLKK